MGDLLWPMLRWGLCDAVPEPSNADCLPQTEFFSNKHTPQGFQPHGYFSSSSPVAKCGLNINQSNDFFG